MLKIKKIRICCALLALISTTPGVWSSDGDEMVLSKSADGDNKLKFNANEPKPANAAVAEPQSTSSSLRVVGFWLVLLGLGGGAFVFLKRRQNLSSIGGKQEARLAVLERLPLGAHRELLLVKACDRLLVVASQGNQMSLLSDLPSENSSSLPFSGMMEAEVGALSSRPNSNDAGGPVVRHPRLSEYAQQERAAVQSIPAASSAVMGVPEWPGADA